MQIIISLIYKCPPGTGILNILELKITFSARNTAVKHIFFVVKRIFAFHFSLYVIIFLIIIKYPIRLFFLIPVIKKKYVYVYEKIKNEIVGHKYSFGVKLPSKRSIADNLSVSVITVEQALDLLICEGYVKAKQRSGYFVCYRDDLYGKTRADSEENTRLSAAGSQIQAQKNAFYEHDAQNKFYFPLTAYATAVRKILGCKNLTEKSPNAGIFELRQAIADYLFRNRGINVDARRIVIGAGAEYLYGTLAEILKDRVFAVEDPCYDKIKKVYSSRNIEFESLPLTEKGIPSDVLLNSKASVLHITPFQSFPTGVTIDISKKKEYIDFAEKRGGFVIEDDYASKFSITSKISDTLFSLDNFDRVIYLNSFSKTIFPSIRAAYVVLPARLLSDYDKYASFYSCPVPVLEQLVIAEILNNGSFERHINKVRRQYKEMQK